MSSHWDDDDELRGPRVARPRRRHRHGGSPGGLAAGTERHPRPRRREITPEERAYREARRRANQRIGFLFHLIPYACTVSFLVFVSFRAALAVGFFWGIGIACHYLAAIGAPRLRQHWIDREVRSQIEQSMTRQRREMGGAHTRSLEELSASIAHEIRNPVTAARSLVQQMGEDPASHENVGYARVALEELDRVERSISHLLRFARDEEIRTAELCLADVVESALETFRDRLERTGVAVALELDRAGPIRGDTEKLRRVVINLIGNALDAFEHEGERADKPRIDVQVGQNLAGDAVWLRIRDNGPGIPPDALQKIWSPFYTGKPDGTGLGLALAKKVVDAHGGSVEANSGAGGGAEFILTFPKVAEGGSA